MSFCCCALQYENSCTCVRQLACSAFHALLNLVKLTICLLLVCFYPSPPLSPPALSQTPGSVPIQCQSPCEML